MTWEGRRLISTTKNGTSIQSSYDDSGLRLSKQDSTGVTRYTYDNGKIVHQYTENNNVITNELFFRYDENGAPLSVNYNGTEYFYVLNLQGDIIAIIDNSGAVVVEYSYDSWGYHSSDDISGTMASTLGTVNPLRYRGYYYDTDTEFYYLSSRYYNPEIGRFVNADNQISAGNLGGMNLFAYCGNNPVNRIDPTGEAWWHWALGAAIVAACAIATVATCGGFAAAATAVTMVSCGVAATTTASTIAASALIGSATVYGMAVMTAACTSNSVEEFCDKGDWWTVGSTAGGMFLGALVGYNMSKAQTQTSLPVNNNPSRGSTGRTEPVNLNEKLAMDQVKSNPSAGTQLSQITLKDPRWSASEGWVEMQQIVPTSSGNVNIHYVYNPTLKIYDDFKYVS